MSLLLVRHGQASYGAADYDQLSERGWEQSRRLGHWLARGGHRFTTVVVGGMRRHRQTAEAVAEGFKPTLDKLKESLKDRAKDVRVTTRLVDSPACLVVEDGDVSNQLARMLKAAGQQAPLSKPILEVNAEHALVKKLESSEHFDDLAHILFDQALLAEGGLPEDPAAYVKRVNALLV